MVEVGSTIANAGVDREIVAESSGMRFTLYTIAPGCQIPWHFHTEVSDWYVCREGAFTVETRAPDESFPLIPGEMADVPAGRVHRVVCSGSAACRFALVQGIGAYDFNRVPG